ncbi:glycine betaine/L-proline ABC transporter substrate-binding protein ProX [Roseospira marina]|uniref:Glycine betaine/L-proline ABC transporter substrate-binding protein ProX n=1 Tax=Roseospira marina TaxID=140057 RepID=A0A5M6IA75_9PROT|nr:glycine betaine/L-proline ABC transporter substrate-binding protein ProX [Roseospira marina]KAA5605160.1 glycine betaine/L-proline ABC transporter substrate-binding protein ProX [Roseospira marina]MBB4314917.1 glycine betaine/proline transport system substrate-binding protein [Roseospira marina]MBB5087917.1 glycine betaine/proline transport system substrate-binding protein [Roseospira marina]
MTHLRSRVSLRGVAVAAGLTTALMAGSAMAQSMPGEGVTVVPLKSSIAEETFQTMLVMKALEDLGYDVEDIKELEYAAAYVAVGNGDGTFLADGWFPLHVDFYEAAGGDEKLYREGVYAPGALQGYLIDKKTAEEHDITNIAQLKDPEIAALFDNNGDGKADLTGCTPGWGCEKVIEHHLDAYGLRDTVTHNQGSYSAIIADTITRYQQGEPILYYTWTPYWVSGVLVPGKDVVWLQVPFSSLPGARGDVDTSLPNGANYGFQANDQRIVANKDFAEANPAAAKLFEIMQISSNDISAQNLKMRDGEDSEADIARHVEGWISGHQKTWDGWLEEARAAAE